MPAKIQKVHRLLDLIALLTSRHYPLTRAQIWDEVEGYRAPLAEGRSEASVRRTFERDKSELLELGFPLRTIEDPLSEPAERLRYQLSHRDFYLPYLRLVRRTEELEGLPKKSVTPAARIAPEQAWLAAEALHLLRRNPDLPRSPAADSAFRKLTFDLMHPDAEVGPTEVILSSDDQAARGRVEELGTAVRERRVVHFEYHSMARDEVASRRVEPGALLFKLNRWYLIAHDLDREAQRVFRVSRMGAVQGMGPPDAFDPSEVDLSEWTNADAWNLPGDDTPSTTVDVRFAFPRSLWAERSSRGVAVVNDDDGGSVRRFEVRSSDPFMRWLLGFGTDVSIVSPPEMDQALRLLRARVAAIYGSDPGAPRDRDGRTGGGAEGGDA